VATLNSRIVEQAKGALAQVLNISVDDAFVVLRDHARRNDSRLVEVSRAVLATPASLTGANPDHRG
jgi:AmiR/NasT family two-component response regulator